MAKLHDQVDFDDVVLMALAQAATASAPPPGAHVKARLMASLAEPLIPSGFAVHFGSTDTWQPHPVAGIRMKVLSATPTYATLLLDVAAGTHFPPHFHDGAEECYVLSGSLHTCGRHLKTGDFVHADPNTHHGELYTEEGCQVLLVIPPSELREWQSANP